MESTEFGVTKGKKQFKVENGGHEEAVFSGNYMKLPVQVINSDDQWVWVKFYIMPHNHCLFGVILGLPDMKKVGYDIAARISDNTLIFKHSAPRKNGKYVKSTDEMFEKCKEMGDEFHCYQLVNKENVFALHQSNEREQKDSDDQKDSEESKDDGRISPHQF